VRLLLFGRVFLCIELNLVVRCCLNLEFLEKSRGCTKVVPSLVINVGLVEVFLVGLVLSWWCVV